MYENFTRSGFEPYRSPFEHITDVCRVMRRCFETDQTEELKNDLDLLREREEVTSETELPLVLIRKRFALSGFEYFCLMLGVLSALEGNGNPPKLSEAISRYPFIGSENVYLCPLRGKPLQYLLEKDDACGIARSIRLKEFIYQFILEGEISDPEFFFSDASDSLPVLYDNLRKRAVDFISSRELSCVMIEGGAGAGKKTLAAQICEALGKSTIFAYAQKNQDAEELAEKITAACVITGSVPVIAADKDGDSAVNLVNGMTEWLPVVLICLNSEEKQAKPRSRSNLLLKIPPADPETRRIVWDFYWQDPNADVRAFAERYRLSVGQIAEVCGRCRLPFAEGRLVDEILSLNSESPVYQLVRPMFRLEDIAAREHIIDGLKRIVHTAESMPELMGRYGFQRLFPYGRGLGVLFCGPPGTGKTMAAYILASELGLGVMKVDLSRIEDKYIGETEKRISEVFEKAEANNCLLFFDEADSLFARRTEVSDSHDRHANAQTAHLLQKMEEFDGIVVLATNLSGNIDPAFRRRLRFVLEFAKPDAKIRAVLWKKFIPEELPREELDFDFLAKAFDLSPAEIQWTAFSAAVYADGAPLSMRHILAALKDEYEKSSLAFPDIRYKKICLGDDRI